MPKFIMLVGLPASGKSTWAKEYSSKFHDLIHLESDAVREEIFGTGEDSYSREKTNKVFEEMHNRTLIFLKKGLSVIYDATNISYKDRRGILGKIPDEVEKKSVLFSVPYFLCQNRNFMREDSVPNEVLENMAKRFNIPLTSEGFDSVSVVYDDSDSSEIYYDGLNGSIFNSSVTAQKKNLPELIRYIQGKPSSWDKKFEGKDFEYREMRLFDYLSCSVEEAGHILGLAQDNPNHTFSVSKHSYHVWQKTLEQKKEFENNEDYKNVDWDSLLVASLFHDFGKGMTKRFENYKGEETRYAHYYNHENVSAYIVMVFCTRVSYVLQEEILDVEKITKLVQFHMKLYPYAEKEKRWKKLISNKTFFKELEILNESDKASK